MRVEPTTPPAPIWVPIPEQVWLRVRLDNGGRDFSFNALVVVVGVGGTEVFWGYA